MARGAYRAVDQRPDPVSKFNLGVRLEEHGDFAAAGRAYRHADERGHAAAAVNLGVLLEDRANLPKQRRHIAVRRNVASRMVPSISGSSWRSVATATARSGAYRFADQQGHAAAACNLGVILAERRDLAGAETAFKRAHERGDSNAVYNLEALESSIALERSRALEPESAAAPPIVPASATPTEAVTDRAAEQGEAMRRHGRKVRTRRAAIVLVPSAVAFAAAFAFGSSITSTPKHAAPPATVAHGTEQPPASVSTVAQVPSPAAPTVHKPAAHKRASRKASAAKATAHHTRSSSATSVHYTAPRSTPAAPTFVASREPSSSTGSTHVTPTRSSPPPVASSPPPVHEPPRASNEQPRPESPRADHRSLWG